MRGGPGIDRRKVGVLSFGHFTVDVAQGAVPALLPFLVIDRGLNVAEASALVLALVGSSSIIQPIFGRMTDLRPMPWLLPAAVVASGVGIAAVGYVSSYPATLAVVTVAGVGVAAYHPEGARYANYVSGERQATGMSIYAVGGNVGFAFGPVIVTPLVIVFGLLGANLDFCTHAVRHQYDTPIWVTIDPVLEQVGNLDRDKVILVRGVY